MKLEVKKLILETKKDFEKPIENLVLRAMKIGFDMGVKYGD